MAEEAATTESGTKTYSEKIQKILDMLKDLTLMDLKELKEAYEDTFGVQAASMAAMPMPGAVPQAEAESVEPTIFNLVLREIGPKKIQVIKAVRELTGLGLKEAKELVDSAAQGPSKVKENLSKEEGETAKKKLDEAGAVASLDPA